MMDLPPVKPTYTTTSTGELKSRGVYKSSMGVLPLRRSESIPELNLVHLRGRSVMVPEGIVDDSGSTRVGANTPVSPRHPVPLALPTVSSIYEHREPLPAILPMVGTTHTATLQSRQAPAKPVIHVPPVKRRKVDVVVVVHDAMEPRTPRSIVSRMINEARLLTQQSGDRATPYSRLSGKPQSYGTSSSQSFTHQQQQQTTVTPTDDPTRVAVENLIASIKSKQLQDTQRQSDRKILDIIHRVLGRTIDLVYDEDEQDEEGKKFEQEKIRQDEESMFIDDEQKIPLSVVEEEHERTGGTPRVPDVSRMEIGNEGDKGETEIDEQRSSIRTLRPTSDENIDMNRDPLYRHFLLGISDEELLNVRGSQMNVTTPAPSTGKRSVTKKVTVQEDKSIHHFCIEMVNNDDEEKMPKEIRSITQLYHQRARFRHQLPVSSTYYKHGKLPAFPITKRREEEEEEEEEEEKQEVLRPIHLGAPSIPYDGLLRTDTDLDIWQRRAAQLVQPEIEGHSALSHDPILMRLWSPAPPKMYVHPRRVKQRLFAHYTSSQAATHDDDEDASTVSEGPDTVYSNWSEHDAAIDQRIFVPVIKPYKSLERLPSTIDHNDEFELIPTMIRTSRSCPNLTDETVIRFDTNHVFTLEETKHQTGARKAVKFEVPAPVIVTINEPEVSIETVVVNESTEPIVAESATASPNDLTYFRKANRSFLYEEAVAAGRPYISSARLRAARRARKDARFWARIDAIVAIASAPPRYPPITRRHSFHEAHFYEKKHPHIYKQRTRKRQASLERNVHQFDTIIKSKYKFEETRIKSAGKRLLNEFEWSREIWYGWLDDYIAELDKRETVRQEQEKVPTILITSDEIVENDNNDEVETPVSLSTTKKIPTIQLEPITNLHLADSEERRLLENEVHRLTILINRDPRDVFNLTRRGGLFRKLGLFHDALNDLSLAIYIEPSFMDAYWQQALIFMIFEHYDDALDSLNMCIKLNKIHAGAYKLRGDIYAIKNDLPLAIANYSQAIRYNPTDHEAFFQRAQTYERRNDILLAMDDYVQVTRLNPNNIEAWYRHAIYYFNTGNYDNTIGDLIELLKRQSDHVSARLHRGLAYLYLENYQNALADFSATLHYDPSNWAAYYHRACLLRTCNSSHALKDFSISLLLNPEYENLGSYLHRALIYTKDNRYDEAIADYEAILVLDREHAPALCNLAIIYMRTNVSKALQLFTRAIEAEPTYVRAYFCRAQLYTQNNQLQQAYSDYTKVYHMFPDQTAAMVLRGSMLLAMGQLDLASFCVQAAARLQSLSNTEETVSSPSSSMKMTASSPQQQAIVHAFLEHYDDALTIMNRECFHHSTAQNYRMLGSLHVKARRFDEARDAFEKCIQLTLNSSTNQTTELYDAYLDLSKCFIQLKQYSQAVETLTTLLKMQQSHPSAEAYLQRGIAKMRMFEKSPGSHLNKLSSNRRPLVDINKALVIEPKNVEAYLVRAAWYARCERYSKGVLNCNEAIRLNPNLVRAYLYRGCLKYSLRLYDHAIVDLTQALKIDPSCSHAYYNRAMCYVRRGNLSQALKDFAIVLSLASNASASKTQLLELETYVNRGLLHYEQKDFDNALADFEHALEVVLTSDNEKKTNVLKHKLTYTIGQCHHRLAQFKQAIEQFKSSETAVTDTAYRHDSWVAQANVYMDMDIDRGKIRATRLFERVLHENPMHERARLNLGYCLQQHGHFQRAWSQFSALLTFNPSHVRALEARALVCLQMNHPQEAFIDLNRALRLQPSSARMLTNRGVIQQYLGDNTSAMCDYRAAMLADPHNALAHYNAGNVLIFHGQFQQAIVLFDRVLEISPRDEAALTNRAIAKAVLKQYDSARGDLERALQLSPFSAHIHADLGQLLLTMNEPIEAERALTRALEIHPCDPVVYKWRGDARAKQDGKRQAALDDYRTCVELTDALQLARKHGLIKPPTKTRRKL